MTFTVDNRTVSLDEVDYFIRKAYNLQRQRKPGLSRAYWMQRHRPNYERWQYDANIELLNLAGLIVDRGERRSGRLLGSPAMALNAIKTIT